MPSARITILAETTIADAVADQVSATLSGFPAVKNIAAQATFLYGAGGTNLKAWLQTSFDQGATWHDVANFAFGTSAARYLQNVHNNPATPFTPAVATDGTLADNTVKSGPLGDRFRVKYTSTGTYTGATSLKIDLVLKD